jgi:glycerophosphoryl diester phosphodiesterase
VRRPCAALALALGAWLALPPAPAAGPAVLVAAHRGGAALWPENSLRAFRGALALGVDAVELDVHPTADGAMVVLHDPALDRTTTGSGPVAAATAADLARLRLRAPDGTATDEPVPALAQALDLLAAAAAEILLEIKADARGVRYPGVEARVLALVRARGLLGRTVIQAFQPETLEAVRRLEPAARTMLLVGRGQTQRERAWPAEAVARARAIGATDLGLNHRLLDADVVAAARAAGLRLSAWTVNEEADMRRVIALGVAVVMTDRPDALLRLLGR